MTLLDLSAADYHADLTGDERPALSKSIIHTLLERSPMHAWAAHPKLNPTFRREDDDKFDVGNVAHRLILEGHEANLVVVHEKDWKKAAAQEAKKEARAAGLTPLLEHQVDRVREMASAVLIQLDGLGLVPEMFTDGKAEQTLVWEEDGVLFKARPDWLRDDRTAIDDLKTTSASAAPEAWSRSMFGQGADLQQVLYQRGAHHLFGVRPEFRFLVVESKPPYAMTPFTLAPDAIAIAERKIDHAIQVWKRCLDTNVWPAYPYRLCHVHAPAWAENQWEDRAYRDEEIAA